MRSPNLAFPSQSLKPRKLEQMTIRQESSFLLPLTERVKSGRAVPAAFQRPYVWSETDIIALWTSIIKGYPLGAFLFWQPSGKDISEYAQAALGPIRIPELQRPALILDGQNRLVTFAWSMTPYEDDVDPSAPGYDIWRSGKVLVADPHLQAVRFVPEAEASKNLLMPVSHLFNRKMQPFFRDNWDGNAAENHLIEWLDGLTYKINGARIVETTIESASAEEALEAFLHIASAGVPVSEADLSAALKLAA